MSIPVSCQSGLTFDEIMPFSAGYFDQNTGDFIIDPAFLEYAGPNVLTNAILAKNDLPNGTITITVDFTFQVKSSSGDLIIHGFFLQSNSGVPPTTVGGLILGFGTVGANQRARINNGVSNIASSSGFSLASPLAGQFIINILPPNMGGDRDVNGRILVPAHSIDINATIANHIQPGDLIRFGFAGGGDGGGPFEDLYNITNVEIVGTNLPMSCPDPTPDIPILTSPADASVTSIPEPVLDWEAAAGADTYEVQLATDAGFTNLLVNEVGVVPTQLDLNGLVDLEHSTQYFWRVRATNDEGSSDWSEVWSFVGLDAPQLISPPNGFQFVSIDRQLFEWEQIPAGGYYWLEIATDSGFNNLVFSQQNITDPFFELSGVLEYGKVYYWRVKTSDVEWV